MRRAILIFGLFVVVLFAGMQLHKPNFDLSPVNTGATLQAQLHPDAQVHNVLRQSCYDCHSTQGEIPWYGHVWPASALLQNDIRKGRARMDFSNWSNLSPEMSHIRLLTACQMMRESKMPLWYYRPMHPGSAPNQQEIEAFCAWVNSTPARPDVAEMR